MNALPPPNLHPTSRAPGVVLADQVGSLALPPLAAVGGVLYPSQVLPHLKPLLDDIHAKIREGQEVVIVNALSGNINSGLDAINNRTDLVTFFDSALRKDPILRTVKIIQPSFPENQQLKELVTQVTDADEVSSSDRKYIILLTDSCLEGVCADSLAVQTFITKLNRAHVGKISILKAPERIDHDVFQIWSEHLEQAPIDKIRSLFMLAAQKPESHPMSGNYSKLLTPFPAKDDSGLMKSYPEQYPIFMQVVQSMLWNPSPMVLVLWGKPSTGKSTLLRAAANFFHQTGLGSNYFLLRDGKIRLEGTAGNYGLGYSATRLLTCIDQIDHADANIDINTTGKFETSNPNWKIIATSNLSPQELREKIGPQMNLISLQILSDGGSNSQEFRTPILNLDFDLDRSFHLGESSQRHQIKDIAHTSTFQKPTLIFLRWEERQWNVDPELVKLSEFLLPKKPE